jgi:tripartite ATP-independent transporter DctM subunit
MSTVGACAGFGAICGSGPATAATMASVALPEMKKYNYSRELATGTVAAGGGLGMLIPPSVVFIVYGIMTEQSVGKLFLAGILPGILIAVLFGLTIYFQCRRHPEKGPTAPAMSFLTRVASLKGVIETLILFVMVMGGMFAGLFTPTEAAGIGALGALIIAMARGKLSFPVLKRTLLETLRTSCMVMVIIAGAVVLGHFLAVSRIPYELAGWLSGLPLPSWIVMGLVILFFLVMGCFIDALALILLTIPIFYPVVLELGYDPIWFGVIIVVVTQMGVISPPVGVNVYIVSGIERDVPLQTIFKGALPFLAALIVAAALLMLFPQITLLLPNLIGSV